MANQNKKIDNSVNVRSRQNLSCNWTGTADFGRLVPIHWEELLQGDKVITCKPRIEIQCLPLASPTFGKIDVYVHYFQVPIRLLQKNFYDIWSHTGVNQNALLSHASPRDFANMYSGFNADNKRAFYKHWTSLGLNPFFELTPANVRNDIPIFLYPFLAYNQIFWDFYRDPEVLRDESKEEYIFDRDIYPGMQEEQFDAAFALHYLYPHVRTIKNNWISDLFSNSGDNGDDPVFSSSELPFNNVNEDASYTSFGEGTAPFSLDTDTELAFPQVNSSKMLRLIESLNRLAERLSLSGKRQIEALYARYGVKPKWSEMNMCRYLGGGKSTVMVDNIISTADTDNSPLGAQAGAGYCALDNVNIKVSVDEPSILMGIASVMPHIHFVQGLSRKFVRKDLVDMFQSSLQYVGEVGVEKSEVGFSYPNLTYPSAQDKQVFAYTEPYYEYKMGLDILAGDFMKYHNVTLPQDPDELRSVLYMQSMEQYVDYHTDRDFKYENLLVDGDQFNKIFNYLGGSVNENSDDHFQICCDKEVIIERPMEGFAVPTLETTKDPHKVSAPLSSDKML